MPDDPRAVLEAIAYGDDANIRPADRLAALQQLGAFEGEALCAACTCSACQLRRELEHLGDDGQAAAQQPLRTRIPDEWVEEAAGHRVRQVVADVVAGRPTQGWAADVARAIDERAQQLAQERAGAQRRASAADTAPAPERARRALGALIRQKALPPGAQAEDGRDSAEDQPVQPPPGIDVDAGWPSRRGPDRSHWPLHPHGR
jgi:hypothetical protein